MNARDAILQRIRNELSGVGPVDPPPVPEVWPRTNATTEQLVERFTNELDAVQGKFIRCGSMEEARRRLADLQKQSQWRAIGLADRPICRELAADLPPENAALAKQGWNPHEMAGLSAGLVAAECLLADTGTCLVECNTAEERLLCYLPPACVIVAKVEQLVEHLPAGWEEIARRTAEPERRGEFVLITGPSRTADIEKILILGVHGPKQVVVILIG